MFDHGQADNMRRYNQSSPPVYDVSKVKVKVVAYTGSHDWMVTSRDSAPLLAALPNLLQHTDIKGWNHMDFILGMNAPEKLYGSIVDWLRKY